MFQSQPKYNVFEYVDAKIEQLAGYIYITNFTYAGVDLKKESGARKEYIEKDIQVANLDFESTKKQLSHYFSKLSQLDKKTIEAFIERKIAMYANALAVGKTKTSDNQVRDMSAPERQYTLAIIKAYRTTQSSILNKTSERIYPF